MKMLIKITVFLMMFLTSFSLQAQYNAGIGSGENGAKHTFVGVNAGHFNTGADNSFFGRDAGLLNTTGYSNSFIGINAGRFNETGKYNSFLGAGAGYSNISGGSNSFVGVNAGHFNTTGVSNSFFGTNSGKFNKTGYYNSFIGVAAGYSNISGSRNVFIGYKAGYNETGSNKLYIDNSGTSEPLIYGDFATNILVFNGNVGIGTTTPDNKLDVCGTIRSKEIKVESGWCDYVFYNDYQLPTLEEEEKHIEANGHLLGFESEEAMEGMIHLGDVSRRQQAKIEEIMLHLIELKKENDKLKEEMKTLKTNK